MIVNLIKVDRMFSYNLPQKVKGQYWVHDLDSKGNQRRLFCIEAINNSWILKSNKNIEIFDAHENTPNGIRLERASFLYIRIIDTDEKVILFTEIADQSRQSMTKISALHPCSLTIGRNQDNNLIFDYAVVSGTHAQLVFSGQSWSIVDLGSKNGIYVNGNRVTASELKCGDLVYIMGLRIIIGNSFFAVNNPDGKLIIRSDDLAQYQAPPIIPSNQEIEPAEKNYYFRSPRFHREVEHAEIKIDPPTPLQKMDTVPLALMLGPSLTMGMASMSTGVLSVTNVLSNGGSITQALPSMIMSFSMLLGTVLWPVLTKRYEKKQKIKEEKKRQKKYLEYLNEMSDTIRRTAHNQSEILNENLISQEECAQRIVMRKNDLWERTVSHSDFMKLRIGIGNSPMDAEIKYPEKRFTMEDDSLQNAMLSLAESPKLLEKVPIAVPMNKKNIVGIYGTKAERFNMLKGLILQMISLHSYDELKIMLITDENDVEAWNFMRFIPHFWNNMKSLRFFASNADEVKEISAYIERYLLTKPDQDNEKQADIIPYYAIIVTSKKLLNKCEALNKLIKYKNNVGFSIILAGEKFNDLPKETKCLIHVNGNASKMFDKDDTTGNAIEFAADRANENIFDNIGYNIANIELDLASQSYKLPTMLTFLEMFNVSKVEHLNSLTRWKENNPTKTLKTPIGVDTFGDVFELDLHEKYHGPHGLVAGMTGSGKSEIIITFILSMAVNYHPDEVAFILIDYKGGGLAGAFEDKDRGIKLPHLAGTITNLDGSAIKRSLVSIQSELRRRQAIFNEARKASNEGTMDIYKYQRLYRDKIVSEPLPHLFIISDEFAELKTQQPEFMEQLISAARIGRSLGVHLILATQKPSGVVDDQIWSNSKFRICLKVQEKADSQDMIKCPDAAEISQTGRFYLQVGFNELFALGQSAWCGAEYLPTETIEKPVDNSIQVVDNLGRIVMSLSPAKKKVATTNTTSQIVSIVKYLSDLTADEKISVRPLWLEPIPEHIYIADIEKKYNVQHQKFMLAPVIGEYDDPFNQKQAIMTVPLSAEGNCLIYGATGSGKTTFITSLCYSLIMHHSAEELNLYLLDFGAETLRAFEKAPQVGGVAMSNDEEHIVNLIKMLTREIESRKELFSEYGGDYHSYISRSGKTMPNIVVVMNNYSGFAEQYEELQDALTLLLRDGVKYGIYFVVTASSVNAVRYKIQQNFRLMLTLQLNDVTDYTVIVGRTDGLVPSKFKGRGLVRFEEVYEFQTAQCVETHDLYDYLKTYCEQLRSNASMFAKRIPVLPKTVDDSFIRPYINTLADVPVGVYKNSLNIANINIASRVVYQICIQDLQNAYGFSKQLTDILRSIGSTVVVDTEQLLNDSDLVVKTHEYNGMVDELFMDMVTRNNLYKESGLNADCLSEFEEKTYVFIGLGRFIEKLSADSKDKFETLIEKAEAIYKLHFVMIDTNTRYDQNKYSAWYKRHITGSDGIWIGDGFADQYTLRANKLTSEMYEEISPEYGYLLVRGKSHLIKLINGAEKENY